VTVRIIGQRGLDFLAEARRGDAMGARDVPLARVYDRRRRWLSDAAPVASILARGYWGEVEIDGATRARVREEIAELL
jgi:hypothetical protein